MLQLLGQVWRSYSPADNARFHEGALRRFSELPPAGGQHLPILALLDTGEGWCLGTSSDWSQTFVQFGMGVAVCLREQPYYQQRPRTILACATFQETWDLVYLQALN